MKSHLNLIAQHAWSRRLLVVGACLSASPMTARAGGFFVGENGSQALSRAGAFAATADDPTAIYHNPAGLALAEQTQVYFGINPLYMKTSFQREGAYSDTGEAFPKIQNQGPPLPIPFLAINVPAGRFAFAAGVLVPYGFAGGTFPERVTTASGSVRLAPQRYDIVATDGLMAVPSAAVAYRVSDHLRLGARFSAVWIQAKAVAYGQAVPNPTENEMTDARSAIDATDPFTPQFGLGAHYKVGALELGAAYTSQLHFDLKGTTNLSFSPGVTLQVQPVPDAEARCARGGKVGALKTCISVTQIPQTAVVGARWVARDPDGGSRGDIELDVRWEDWAADQAENVVIDGENLGVRIPDKSVLTGFRDSWSFRLGGARSFTRDRSVVLRGGVAYDTAPAPLSWTRLVVNGSAAFTFAGGVGFRFSRWQLDAGLAYVYSPTRIVHDVGVAANGQPAQPTIETLGAGTVPFNAGTYERSFLIGTIGVTISFGKGSARLAPRATPALDGTVVAPHESRDSGPP